MKTANVEQTQKNRPRTEFLLLESRNDFDEQSNVFSLCLFIQSVCIAHHTYKTFIFVVAATTAAAAAAVEGVVVVVFIVVWQTHSYTL